MTLAEKFNIGSATEDFIKDTKDSIEKSKTSKSIDECTRLDFLTFETHTLALGLYLLDKKEESFVVAQGILPVSVQYLKGDWQKTQLTSKKTIDPQWWHSNISWYRRFREDLMWLSSIGNFDGCAKILSFIDEDACDDKKAGPFGKKYYIALRAVFESQDSMKYEHLFNDIKNAGNKKYGTLAEIVLATLRGDCADVKKHWLIAFKTWKEKEAKMDWCLARELTFLYHFAALKGIAIDLPCDIYDHVVHFPHELLNNC